MKKTSYRLLILLCVLANLNFCIFSYGQVLENTYADSLINLFSNNDLHDTTRYNYALKISINSNSPTIKLKFAKEALVLAKKFNVNSNIGAAWINIGQAQRKLGHNEEALEALLKGMHYYQLDKKKEGIASANLALANIYLQQEHYKLSLHYNNEAIKIFRELNDTTRLTTALLNTGETYRLSKNYDSAMLYFNESKLLFKKIGYNIGYAYATGNIGLVKTTLGDLQNGEQLLEEAIGLLKKSNNHYAIVIFRLSLADIYFDKGDSNNAIKYTLLSWNISRENNLMEPMRDACEKLSRLYAIQKDYPKAYDFQSKYIAYRDSINNEEVIRKMADLRTEYEVSQKQAEIDLLEKTKENQRLVQYGLILFAVLVIFIAVLLFRNNSFQKKVNHLLVDQKDELSHKNERLDALIATREKFFSIISHDLRGPVNAFHGLSTIINSYVQNKEYDAIPEVATHIEKAALHLSMLLDNLLSWAVNQKGTLPVNAEMIDIKSITENVVAIFQTMALSKKIQLNSNIEQPMKIWSDKNSYFTILRNLINNALKFTPFGGEVYIDAKNEGEYTCISINDNGVGISQEKLNNLFNKKESQRTWGTSGEKGLGLGLQLVYEFVHLNNGFIKVESEEEKGSSFFVFLPSHPLENKSSFHHLEDHQK